MNARRSPADPAWQENRWEAFVERVRSRPDVPFDEQWSRFREIYAKRRDEDGAAPAWRPTPAEAARSNAGRLMAEVGVAEWRELHAWSAREREAFWRKGIEGLGVAFALPPSRILDPSRGVEEPRWLPGARMNCAEGCFHSHAARPAVISGREGSRELKVVSRGELDAMAAAVASGLRERGFVEGDAIALYMPMTIECVAAYLGIVRAGCCAVSIADSFSVAELRRRLEIGRARGIFTVDRFVRAGRTIDLHDKVRDAGAPRAVVIAASGGGGPVELRPDDLRWDELLRTGGRGAPSMGDPERMTNVLFSSGTTGTPKAIPWTHLTPIKCAVDGRFHQDIRAGDVVAWPTNIGWMMGPWLIYASLINGAAMALYEGLPSGEGFARFIEEAGVTVLGVVPSLVRAWRTDGATEAADWSHIRVFSSTGEPSNREDYLWLMSRTGYRAPVIEYCGGTEIGGGYLTGSVVQPASPAAFTTPALGMDVVILDDAGRPVGEGGTGECFLVPPSIGLSQTLLNGEHHEVYYAGCPRGPGNETLRRHGDHVVRLHRGFYRARGRVDDTMNLGGIKVSSLELEQVIDAHEAVCESAAVAAQPEGEGAEMLVVYVVPRGDSDPATLSRELNERIARVLNPLFKIHDLVLTGHLPRTASHKLMRRELRAQYARRSLSPRGPGQRTDRH